MQALPQELRLVAQRHPHWPIVIAHDACPHARAFEGHLRAKGTRYIRVASQEASNAPFIRMLGTNLIGLMTSRGTPTTLVAERVVRGTDYRGLAEVLRGP